MFHKITQLPTGSTSHQTPGWAYVSDTRHTGAAGGSARRKASGGRKRVTRDLGGGGGGLGASSRAEASSRQNNAVLRHLAELDRENPKDTHVPVPTKQKDSSSSGMRGSRGKITSNVRRILMSQKTFKNYLDDEEAALAQLTTNTTQQQRATAAAAAAAAAASRASTTPRNATPKPDQLAATTTVAPLPPSQAHASHLIISENDDSEPLLRSYIPSAPSEKIMQALLAEPPLSYNASRATLSSSAVVRATLTKSQRHFCNICGYWGRVKCVKCRERACGLECYRVHEDTRCERRYA
ncbi:hypothetical protein AJ80_09648 [Polytolypa hystricis UAMH7299]|uniref:HIT-type domain-containing protein n=1 Tax=Polytolypa hystricis (strain UAMH7299) TaxID=1447883 RepID=A0A2B7WE44_POLH7|nr:hypothetical protein AJ80_09648 [Polytolypa hystricis UAMH7299]